MTKEKWWDDEAKRLDQMAQLVRKKKVMIKVGKKKPPALKEDGSLDNELGTLLKKDES